MFNIIVITPETTHPNETEVLNTLVRDYNCIIHIRKPSFSLQDYREYLQLYNHLLPHFVLHEHHSLAKEFAVKGIHLKESDRNNINTIDFNTKIISTSIHCIEDASALSYSFEYIFYSPLFESISKQNYGSNKTYEALKKTIFELKKRTSISIIGLGGIHEDNIALVKECGFDGAALLGAIWEKSGSASSFEKIICFR